MKKMMCIILAVLILLPVFSVTAFASCHGGHGNGRHGHSGYGKSFHYDNGNQKAHKNNAQQAHNGVCAGKCDYIDENGDNICDNCKNQCAQCGETKDENSDGICDNCGKCSHYADENKDDFCDHQTECASRKKAACKSANKKSSHPGGNHSRCR